MDVGSSSRHSRIIVSLGENLMSSSPPKFSEDISDLGEPPRSIYA